MFPGGVQTTPPSGSTPGGSRPSSSMSGKMMGGRRRKIEAPVQQPIGRWVSLSHKGLHHSWGNTLLSK